MENNTTLSNVAGVYASIEFFLEKTMKTEEKHREMDHAREEKEIKIFNKRFNSNFFKALGLIFY